MSRKAGATVGDVGEFGLIALLREALPPEVIAGPSLLLGIGDDAAVWRPEPGRDLVITTDSLVEDVHFRLDWTDWTSLGHKSLAVNLSDLAAMGAIPRLALVTLGLRGTEAVDDLIALYDGLGSLALRSGTLVVGGDIVRSPAALTIHVTAIGDVASGTALNRAGARPGEVIAVSGTLGAAAAGLRLLAQGLTEQSANPATAATLIAAHLRPEPRLALGQVLQGRATSVMDLSDGLLGDLPKILAESGVAAELAGEQIPLPAAVRALFPDDWFDLATRGGEDYELLFTLPPDELAALVASAAAIGSSITPIGHVREATTGDPMIVIRAPDGRTYPADAGAFDHFEGEGRPEV